jgi:phytoene synthase
MSAPGSEAMAITRASKSNLALAFVSLPRERREDMTVFYAWCRVIDDIADDPGQTVEQRRAALAQWKGAVQEPVAGESTLAAPVRALIAKYQLQVAHFHEIIAGVEMDLAGASYETWEDLRLYCHRVASVVGLISIEIFGCRDPLAKDYAENLGIALQLTNIIRDVGEDFANGGRIYLPRADLAQFHYAPEDLAAARDNEAFLSLMRFEASRARGFFTAAAQALPQRDRRALVAAEIMHSIYRRLLDRMERDGFHVFGHRYSLGRLRKLSLITRAILRARFL